MYQASSGLPHLLRPSDYFDETRFHRERDRVLIRAWHFIATTDQLKNDGDFVTATLFEHEVYVRNFQGNLRAFANVCAHRHSLIQSAKHGNSSVMRCQYHGWEYGEDGCTRKIPCAKEFAPLLDRARQRLTTFRVESCGQIVFVCLDKDAVDLKTFLGSAEPIIRDRFGENRKQHYRQDATYEANWKVSIENSLEAYHIESVHPNTFKNAPAESRCEHVLEDRYTSFTTDMPFAASHRMDEAFQRSESWFVERLGGATTRKYSQHHVFPNLLFSCTDAISMIHSVIPLSPTRSTSHFVQFGLWPKNASFVQRRIAKNLGRVEAMILHRILREDIQIYPIIQRGLNVSTHEGMLARSEERIFCFQKYLMNYR